MPEFKLGVIGLGRMGAAIVESVISNNLINPAEIIVCDIDEKARSWAKSKGLTVAATNRRVVQDCKLVLLVVKPQIANEVLEDIQANVSEGTCFISIMAGISSEHIRSKLPAKVNVIRVMPNTPLLVGKAATVIAKADDVPPTYYRATVSIFSVSGDVVFLDEDKMNEIIPLSSSSPAFFYRMAAVMLRYAEEMGVDSAIALRLIAQAMEGSAIMLRDFGNPSNLIAQVASPGGTTVAALNQLDINAFDDALSAALTACKERADQLGR
ncbi:pyrroline-5-carboxylate reductase [Clostridia bacterium]|nr:pyrroline-5-carboxylate reductase [Clostridia bacterium]